MFDLDTDPSEMIDLIKADDPRAQRLGKAMDARLDASISASSASAGFLGYRDVSEVIESYNKQSFVLWRATMDHATCEA